jgi:hypothetical protein
MCTERERTIDATREVSAVEIGRKENLQRWIGNVALFVVDGLHHAF